MERSECECNDGNTWARHADDGGPGVGSMPVCVLDVSSIRKTDGDAGGCRCERDEIPSVFEKVSSGAKVNYKWRRGGRRFGIDNMANIV
jgi:hypothetical protein